MDKICDPFHAIVQLKVVCDPESKVPYYATKGSSGFDIPASSYRLIEPGRIGIVPTGLRFSIPEGYEIQLRSRSGLATKGIFVANSPATIDSDYTGEIKVILMNLSGLDFEVRPGDRIAQGVMCSVIKPYIVCVRAEDLPQTERGGKGLGSTGI